MIKSEIWAHEKIVESDGTDSDGATNDYEWNWETTETKESG